MTGRYGTATATAMGINAPAISVTGAGFSLAMTTSENRPAGSCSATEANPRISPVCDQMARPTSCRRTIPSP